MVLNHLEYDSVLGAAFALATTVSLGIVGSLTVLGIDLTATQQIAGISLANSSIVSILALLGVVAANTPSLNTMRTETKVLGGATALIVLTMAVSPTTLDFVTYDQSAILAFAVFGVESGGFWSLATSR